jgi:HK97 gp10 family phage protein
MAKSELFWFEYDGFEELNETFNELLNDFGEKDQKSILRATIREALQPVLAETKMRAPVDTGALQASLRIEARKPNSKDKRSRYYNPGQVVVGFVTTAPGKVLAKTSFFNRKNTKSNIKQVGIPSDARANVQEFGSYKMAAHPYMRVSLESNAQTVTNTVGKNLRNALEKYKAKQMRSKLK